MTATQNSSTEDATAIRREASKVEDACYYAENLLRSLGRLDPELLTDAVENVNSDTPDAREMMHRLAAALRGIQTDDWDPIVEVF